jgi:kynurenine formamidase
MTNSRLIDLSHDVEHGMTTYPGLPAPIVCDYLSRQASRALYAAGVEFHIGKIEMVANTGTYVDAPFHRYEDGIDLADLPLEKLANLEAIVVRPGGRAATLADFRGLNVRGKAVLVHTGWDAQWRTERYGRDNPFISREAAEWLASAGASLVGIDSVNIDDLADWTRPAHSVLLGAGIPICEHLTNLRALAAAEFRFFAVPVKVRRLGTFPVRAFGILP